MPRYDVNVFKVQEQRRLTIDADSASAAMSQGLSMVRERKGIVVAPPRKRLVAEARILMGSRETEELEPEPETKQV